MVFCGSPFWPTFTLRSFSVGGLTLRPVLRSPVDEGGSLRRRRITSCDARSNQKDACPPPLSPICTANTPQEQPNVPPGMDLFEN